MAGATLTECDFTDAPALRLRTRTPYLPIGTDADDGRDTDPEQLSSRVDRESAMVCGYDQSSNGSLISSPSRKAPSSAGSWPG